MQLQATLNKIFSMCVLQYNCAKFCSVACHWVGKALQKLVTDEHLDVASPQSMRRLCSAIKRIVSAGRNLCYLNYELCKHVFYVNVLSRCFSTQIEQSAIVCLVTGYFGFLLDQ